MEEISVNDGNGLFDSNGLIDSMIMDCNELVKQLTHGDYVLFCQMVVQMVQKLSSLKKGINSDMKSLQEQIDDLVRINEKFSSQLYSAKEDEQNV